VKHRLSNQSPEILKKLISDYEKFAKDVGVVAPTGSIEAFQTVNFMLNFF
jgi:hypothetical protein